MHFTSFCIVLVILASPHNVFTLYELDCEDCDFKFETKYTIDPKIPFSREMDVTASDLIERYMIFPAFKFPFEGVLKSFSFVSEDTEGSFELSICKELVPNEKYQIDYSVIIETDGKNRKRRTAFPRNDQGSVLQVNVFSDSNKLSTASFASSATHTNSQKYDEVKLGPNATYVLGIGFTHETSKKNNFLMFSSSPGVPSPVLKMIDPVAREDFESDDNSSTYQFDFRIIPDLNAVPGIIFEMEAFCPVNCREHMPFYGRSACQRDSGACSYGCKDGWSGEMCNKPCDDHLFGPNCTHFCSLNCQERLCDSQTGKCFKCEQGFYGVDCKEACGHCANGTICGETGECSNGCISHFLGPFCTECKNGYYQANETTCKICGNCLNSAPCDKRNGSCFPAGGCALGFQLPYCLDSCPVGHFGYNCINKCGHCTEMEKCNFVDGVCTEGCETKWYGQQCLISHESSSVALTCDTAQSLGDWLFRSNSATTAKNIYLTTVLMFQLLSLGMYVFV